MPTCMGKLCKMIDAGFSQDALDALFSGGLLPGSLPNNQEKNKQEGGICSAPRVPAQLLLAVPGPGEKKKGTGVGGDEMGDAPNDD